MNLREELLAKIQKIEENLRLNKELGIHKLERLSAEARRAFDNAIEMSINPADFMKELEERKEMLKNWRISLWRSIFPVNLKYILSMPFIYGMAIPGVFFHLCIEIYHQICFRIYGIPLVDRKEYFIYDRHLLPYLNWLEKLNCIYCSYFNNLLRYSVEIGGRTERFWCPIKYARRVSNTHSQYNKFVDTLDAENFRDKWKELRDFSDMEKHEGGVVSKKEATTNSQTQQ